MTAYQRVVVKLGTGVLTANTDRLFRPRLVEFLRQIAQLRQQGKELILVSSGAVLAGWEQLGFPRRRRTIQEKQFLAAVGQGRLMHLYAQIADIYGITVAQTLMTRDDFRVRQRYLNARGTLMACIAAGVLPIVNENDVVTVDEIRLGDNDTLAARVASLVDADLLLICTDCDGLFTADPRQNPEASLIEEVAVITEDIFRLAGAAGSHRGTGGMFTKLQAADLATRAGVDVVIANGGRENLLLDVVAGRKTGTHFGAHTTRLEARKRWILAETARASRVVVDAGASRALVAQGKSLLPVGIVQVEGSFDRGQTIRIYDQEGREIARGLTRYASNELKVIQGRRSGELEELLGYASEAEVVHRDDMVLLNPD